MKSSILILNICAVLISTFSISSAFAEEHKKLEAVSNLDLQKFQ
jgi:hypothetical protein